MSDLNAAMQWRYATKRMNGQQVASEKLDNILQAIRLSASSFGLQPYRLIVVADAATKDKIHAQACQQPQVTECSHLLVFASLTRINAATVSEYIGRIAKERGISPDAPQLQEYAQMMNDAISARSAAQISEWAARQAYIGLGTGMVAAAMERVDATPMEGFDPPAMDSVLGLADKGLSSRVLLALGYRDAEQDYLAQARKVRLSAEQFVLK